MADTKRLAGIANIAVDGITHQLSGDLTYSPSQKTRETLAGQDDVHGFKEMPVAGYISGTLRDARDLTIKDFNDMTDVTITLNLANGKTVIGRNMWCVNVQEVKTVDGTFEVRFEGKDVLEI